MTWQARLPAKITKSDDHMITARPCMPAYPAITACWADPPFSALSTDYAKTLTR